MNDKPENIAGPREAKLDRQRQLLNR